MKKALVFLLLSAMLAGCGTQETFETVEDIIEAEPVAAPRQFFVSLPDEAAAPTFQDDAGELYVCSGYSLSRQVLDSGDLERTVKTLSGQSAGDLQILKTAHTDHDRYDFVWTAAGEEGLQLGRACILDDGNYHYTLTALAREENYGDLRETIQVMFDSCTLLDPEVNLSTGS